MKDDLNGRQTQCKKPLMEDELKEKGSEGKNTSMEECLDGTQPRWEPYRK